MIGLLLFKVLKQKRYFFVTHLIDEAQISGIPDGIFIVLTVLDFYHCMFRHISFVFYFFIEANERYIRAKMPSGTDTYC